MKYRSFTKIVGSMGVLVSVCLLFAAIKSLQGCGNAQKTATVQQQVVAPTSASTVSVVATTMPVSSARDTHPLTTDELRSKLESWLTQHGDRQGRTRLENILPNESFKATAIRFGEADAARFSNDPRQWSQIRIDRDRDGFVDEKWLLKNGHTYKRETVDRDGKTITTQYFNK